MGFLFSVHSLIFFSMPIPSMYGTFTYIWLVFMVNVGRYINTPYVDGMLWEALLLRCCGPRNHDVSRAKDFRRSHRPNVKIMNGNDLRSI